MSRSRSHPARARAKAGARSGPPPSRGYKAAAASFAAILLSSPAAAQSVAIVDGRLAIGDGSAPVDGGTVVIRDGRVVAAGRGVAVPAGMRTVDARGKWVAAGIVAGFTRIGIVEVDGVQPTDDARAEKSRFTASLDMAPMVNPRGIAIGVSRAGGVTRALVAPSIGAGVFAGQGAVIDLATDADPITRARAFQFVELGEDGAKAAGGSRPAAFAELRNALAEARDYARAPGAYGGDGHVLPRLDAAALVPVLDGRQPLLVHVERASDIRAVIGLRRDFPALRLVLVGADEGWTVAREIAAAGVPVLASALADLPVSFEQLAATQSNIGRMKAAGVTVGIGMIGDNEARQARLETQYAGNLVALTRVPGATGLDWGAAFAAITSKPADALGMGGEIGSLRAGRRGDVVIWDGDPLELSSAPVAVWIDGVEQPIRTRQTELRDRYAVPQEGALPKAYERR